MLNSLIVIIISMVLVSNYPLAQFLGICPFLGVSKDLDSAKGMGCRYFRNGTCNSSNMAYNAAAIQI